MDDQQQNHLKAYGVAYWVLQKNIELEWLLNYRGGSFMSQHSAALENELQIRGVSFDLIPDSKAAQIREEIAGLDVNMDVMKLEKPPKIAVYSPKTKLPWDDAVTLALTYAEIPYTLVYDDEVINGDLPKYDWLHLHHEDFTGQYGKFYAMYRDHAWYRQQQAEYEASAQKYGMNKVSKLKLASAQKIKEFVAGGGFLFAMCSATDTYDIALSASGTDICETMFDGDAADPSAQSKLDYNQSFAFKNFKLITNPFEYEFSNIDSRPNNQPKKVEEKN
ncbi:MAG: asparagine synthetase B, partial [Methylotenera sp.]|nr:asparagine synthetase B [Flavobacterium sp.]